LDKDFSDAHRAAAIAQALFHALAGAHNGNAADFALEAHAGVGLAGHGGGDGGGDDGEVVQAFFDEEADDAVGVEDEVSAVGAFVTDHAIERPVLARLFTILNLKLNLTWELEVILELGLGLGLGIWKG
jgi:hypothetical protein